MAHSIVSEIATLTEAQLGEFVRAAVVKSAVQLWQAGHALAVVRKRLEGTDTWTTWLRTYWPMSERTAYRWIEVAEAFDLKDLKAGQSVSSVFKLVAERKRKTDPLALPGASVDPGPADGIEPFDASGTAEPIVTFPRLAEAVVASAPAVEAPEPATAAPHIPATVAVVIRPAEHNQTSSPVERRVVDAMQRHGIAGDPLALFDLIEDLFGLNIADLKAANR